MSEILPSPTPGVETFGGFPLPRPKTLLKTVLKENGLDSQEFERRRHVWRTAADPILKLVDEKSRLAHLTSDPAGLKANDYQRYFEGFRAWKNQTGQYHDAVDAQSILSDGSDESQIENFRTRLAEAAINEGLITEEDYLKIRAEFQEIKSFELGRVHEVIAARHKAWLEEIKRLQNDGSVSAVAQTRGSLDRAIAGERAIAGVFESGMTKQRILSALEAKKEYWLKRMKSVAKGIRVALPSIETEKKAQEELQRQIVLISERIRDCDLGKLLLEEIG
ncbi:MAG: hypothetical protein WC489_01270 [Patescibacteria group bacterium]